MFNSQIEKALAILEFKELTDIQKKVIPVLLDKKDCIVQSKTGSGKTAAFVLPILNSIDMQERSPQALILAPTRELALQIQSVFNQIGTFMGIKTLAIVGKQSFEYQKEDLKQRCHIVIGTPGRILHHIYEGNISLDKMSYFILDEADEMLNLDFMEDIQTIYSYLNGVCVGLFSATISSRIQNCINLKNPIFIQSKEIINFDIDQKFYLVEDKLNALCHILCDKKPESCMIFVNTRQEVESVYDALELHGVSVDKLHGKMEQDLRYQVMNDFKKRKFRILITTDVAARGIDVMGVDLVMNYDMPNTKKIYTHRIGRTGRMNHKGCAISLVNDISELEEYKVETETLDENVSLDFHLISTSCEKEWNSEKKLRQDIMKLYINIGKDKNVRAKDIVGALCQICDVEFEDIGSIQVQNHHSYVDIQNGKGNLVLENLKTIKKKKVKVQIAKEK